MMNTHGRQLPIVLQALCVTVIFIFSQAAGAQAPSTDATGVMSAQANAIPQVSSESEVAVEQSVHRLRSSKIRASQKAAAVLPANELELTPAIIESAAICPAANCDCGAITLAPWRERCLAAELTIKQDCVNNKGVPRQYCMLHGPSASPVAITASRSAVPVTTPESLSLHKRKISMLIWSVKDDLDNLQQQEQQQLLSRAMQIHKLLDLNLEQLYATQRLAAEGERQRVGDAPAQELWRDYREELTDLHEALEAYTNILWSNMKAATEPEKQKAYRVLAMRIGRSGSLLSEHYAEAYAGEGNPEGAAKAWQRAALLSTDLTRKEQATTNNPKRIAYYRHQSAARWNRASFYWMSAKNENAIARALDEAERALTFN